MATGADYEVVDVSSGEEITNPGANDVMVAFHKSTGALEKIDYNKLAKAIIEQYTGSNIGGAAQSVKAAVDAVTSRLNIKSPAYSSCTTAYEEALLGTSFAVVSSASDAPSGGGWTIEQFKESARYGYQIAKRTNDSVIYYRKIYAGTCGDWEKQPTRAEMNYVNNATTVKSMPSPADFDDYTETGAWRCDLLETAVTNGPSVGTFVSGFLFISKYNSNNIIQRFCFVDASKSELIRFKWNGTWSAWVKHPTRAELENVLLGISTGIRSADPTTLSITLNDVSYDGIKTFINEQLDAGEHGQRWVICRINPASSAPKVAPVYGSGFSLMFNCSSKQYGWGIIMTDNTAAPMMFGQLTNGNWTWHKLAYAD